jgi:hypothetical protein
MKSKGCNVSLDFRVKNVMYGVLSWGERAKQGCGVGVGVGVVGSESEGIFGGVGVGKNVPTPTLTSA